MKDQDFEMYAGSYRIVRFTVTGITDDDDVSAALWVLRKNLRDADLIVKTLTDGISIADGVDSIIVSVVLDPEDTEDLAGCYRHELRLTDVATHPDPVAEGAAIILYSMTN